MQRHAKIKEIYTARCFGVAMTPFLRIKKYFQANINC